ncbi:S9 family peptidase [Microbulbifer thermotolerans]|uniref:S9 family peptidase n=1 Tax=Microbulbifer thermotolerans TaxID=252514 RepID=A0AB35HWQ6_MICTH|nr:S9 family peptidase [Microbulbifer thermotolerans]MCX2779543.1 S9 family peptidase [Microbulbifer thermotolerans]MCX2801356.1 S9 family peptidase [Microbulbifer thermotolerans]MCX2805647.1 S9 family peptidase [Microbulbifer thermotolerans]MCX2830554.1 S9 family peptidase [Microbulbifer thermotolerans]MCX2840599.1 S9 family peptidase [Microbulbifer thermotolerans]
MTFLKGREEDYNRYDLWEYNIADGKSRILVNSDSLHKGEEQLSDEEKARRERQRIYGSGIMEYTWSENGKSLLFPLAGDVYYYDLERGTAKRLTETEAFETDVRVSPKGRYVSFIRDQNIFIVDLQTGRERQLTRDGGGAIKNGMAEFVAQEEMDRMTGYWWSPDERHIAYLRVDESPVDEVVRSEIYADRIEMIRQRYPAAGRPNVKIQLGLLDIDTGKTRWLDLGKEEDIYIPRVDWARDDLLSYQWQNRSQQKLELRLYDLTSGKTRKLLTETSDTWVNLHDDLHFLKDSDSFIWSSERDGYKHLYLYDLKGKLLRQLTEGDWAVDELSAVDEERALLYFTGRKDTPLERHLYAVDLNGKEGVRRVSRRAGMHGIAFAKDASGYIDKFSSITTPPQVSLHRADGERITWLEENAVVKGHPLYPYKKDWIVPEFGSFKAPEGHQLYYRLYKPAGFDAKKKYPVLVFLYGGPHAQLVTNSWDREFNQYMAQQGYVVFTLDNRGSAHRGTAFENPIYKRMGTVEVDDQVAGVKFLRSLPYVDGDNIGVYGHSYGGYMALMTMFKAGDYFKAGVSGAPVTDWTLYDTHYTERYMGNPNTDGEEYQASSVFPYVDGLKGPLLIYHGMADDNVLFTNTTRLIKTMQDKGKQFELMTYPGKKHSLRGKPTRIHMYTMIARFFDRHLKSRG